MIFGHLKNKIQGERGQSVLELALILPILLMLILGISEFGRAWMTMNLLTGAVREGARMASVTPNIEYNQEYIESFVENYLAQYNIESRVSVMPDHFGQNMWRVTATVDFSFLPAPLVRRWIGTDITMARTATCYYEGQY